MKALDELLWEMPGHRRLLRRAWSPETVHPDYPYRAGDPVGQCGPTAMWVTQYLRNNGYDARFAEGSVAFGRSTDLVIPEHHWTEVGDMVIDLTGSQAPRIPFEVIVESRDRLAGRGLYYRRDRLDVPEKVTNLHFWSRYAALTDRLVQQSSV